MAEAIYRLRLRYEAVLCNRGRFDARIESIRFRRLAKVRRMLNREERLVTGRVTR